HSDMHIIVRTSRATSDVMKLIRSTVADLDAALPVIDVRSADDIVAASARPQQLTGRVIGAFAVSALGLAAIGLYGLISYSVAQRLAAPVAEGGGARDRAQVVGVADAIAPGGNCLHPVPHHGVARATLGEGRFDVDDAQLSEDDSPAEDLGHQRGHRIGADAI